jgi:hypothetical protein
LQGIVEHRWAGDSRGEKDCRELAAERGKRRKGEKGHERAEPLK